VALHEKGGMRKRGSTPLDKLGTGRLTTNGAINQPFALSIGISGNRTESRKVTVIVPHNPYLT